MSILYFKEQMLRKGKNETTGTQGTVGFIWHHTSYGTGTTRDGLQCAQVCVQP